MKQLTRASAIAIGLALSIGLLPAYAGPDDDKDKGEKEVTPALCPVTGEPVDFTSSTMMKEGPVYLCCPPCAKKLKHDPKKYAKKVAEQREALAKLPRIQVSCPVTGKQIDKKAFVEHKGQKVYFFCDKCPKEFQKDPAKYEAKLAASYTYQTKCAISGGEIDPNTSLTLEGGQKVYFCCKGCIPKFKKDPAKYTPNLAKQGYTIDPEDVKVADESTEKKHEGHKKTGHEGHDH
jgi:YHS domain-containing protein